jgi:hypothetical protein
MPYISQAKFARVTGCPQSNVNRAVRQGKLVDEGHGIDPDLPKNAAWARARVEGRTARERAAAEREAAGAAATTPASGQTLPPGAAPNPRAHQGPRSGGGNSIGARASSVANDKLVFAVDANAKAIKAATEEINYRAKKLAHLRECGKTIETADRDRSLGAIVAVIENHLRPFADRVADQLAAMAGQPELRTPFADYLDSEIDKALTAAQAARDHEIQTSEQRNLVDEIDLDGPAQIDGDTDTDEHDDADDEAVAE